MPSEVINELRAIMQRKGGTPAWISGKIIPFPGATYKAGGNTNAVPEPEKEISLGKTGRNEPCPCGSGKKYKNCCGRIFFSAVVSININN